MVKKFLGYSVFQFFVVYILNHSQFQATNRSSGS
jgi:hypothetical protein